MAMDLRDPNVWISHLLENLPEEKLASALKDDNPDWEYIDGEIVKLDLWPTVNWISRNSSAGGWSFWLRRVRTFVCWRIC